MSKNQKRTKFNTYVERNQPFHSYNIEKHQKDYYQRKKKSLYEKTNKTIQEYNI